MMHYEAMIRRININDQPLVSIITTLYNAEKYIEETILSVQNQSYKNWEHIIIDDSSKDRSVEITDGFVSNDNRIQVIKLQKNKGAAYCINEATKIAKGTYIAFLDSDDLWDSQKLKEQIKFMDQNDCLVSYSNYLHIDESGQSLKIRILALDSLSYKKQYRNNYIGNLTGIYNSKVLGKIFAPNMRKRQDWAVWLEAIKRSNKPALGIKKDLAYYRVRKGSISAKKLSLLKYNFFFYYKHLDHSFLKSLFFFVQFLFEYFFIRTKQIKNYK